MGRAVANGKLRQRMRPAGWLAVSATVLLAVALTACSAAGDRLSGASPAAPASGPAIAIAKWFDNRTAAISITYDSNSYTAPEINRFAAAQGLALDYEMVTQRFWRQPLPDWVDYDLTARIPDDIPGQVFDLAGDAEIEHLAALTAAGFGYFGHGHWHVDHDVLTYDEAYQSFRICYEIMESLGLPPVAYGYPRNAGYEPETQQAVADAGFLAARLVAQESAIRFLPGRLVGLADPYIVPDDDVAPENWYALPAVVMESYDFQQCRVCTNDTAELIPILDGALEKTAWFITMYHSIGNTAGYGYYEWDDFQHDLRAVAERDFWVAPMGEVVLYILEREKATVAINTIATDGRIERVDVTLADGLDNARFNQPLTLLFTPPPDWAGQAIQVTQNGELIDRITMDGDVALVALLPNETTYSFQPAE